MPRWLMKPADDTYREWSTVVDEWVSEPMDRDEAVAQHGEDRVEFTDKHLCSCRARLGETIEIRNGQAVAVGGGDLAYHFDSYEKVAWFCRTQDEMREEGEPKWANDGTPLNIEAAWEDER